MNRGLGLEEQAPLAHAHVQHALADAGLIPENQARSSKPDHGVEVLLALNPAGFANRSDAPVVLPHVGNRVGLAPVLGDVDPVGVSRAHGRSLRPREHAAGRHAADFLAARPFVMTPQADAIVRTDVGEGGGHEPGAHLVGQAHKPVHTGRRHAKLRPPAQKCSWSPRHGLQMRLARLVFGLRSVSHFAAFGLSPVTGLASTASGDGRAGSGTTSGGLMLRREQNQNIRVKPERCPEPRCAPTPRRARGLRPPTTRSTQRAINLSQRLIPSTPSAPITNSACIRQTGRVTSTHQFTHPRFELPLTRNLPIFTAARAVSSSRA